MIQHIKHHPEDVNEKIHFVHSHEVLKFKPPTRMEQKKFWTPAAAVDEFGILEWVNESAQKMH